MIAYLAQVPGVPNFSTLHHAAQVATRRDRWLPPARHTRAHARPRRTRSGDQTDTRTQKEKESRPPRCGARRTKQRCLAVRCSALHSRSCAGSVGGRRAGPSCPPRENPQFPRPKGIDGNALARFDRSEPRTWARPTKASGSIVWVHGPLWCCARTQINRLVKWAETVVLSTYHRGPIPAHWY